MLKLISALFSKKSATPKPTAHTYDIEPPTHLSAAGVADFALQDSMVVVAGTPAPDWDKLYAWTASIAEPAAQAAAWERAELAWLNHLRVALGSQYHLDVLGEAVVLSSLDEKSAATILHYMTKTLQRIVGLLKDVAQVPSGGRDILIVLDDEQQYYEYVSRYYADDGEYALSSGMYINYGCAHFVCVKSEITAIEPIIAHEMTHSCVAHLPIPTWLNEGLAVNTESKLCRIPHSEFSPAEMRTKHQQFWTEATIQEFWSGQSFLRSDDGNRLSYDLGRILVQHLSPNWPRFAQFACAANFKDGGAQAAHQFLGIELGAMVAALFEIDDNAKFSPEPSGWHANPERGGF